LILGRLQPDRFLGGEFTLDVERTLRIVKEWLKKSGTKLSAEEFAAGVIRVVNATMEKAIRVVSIERGYDPREFALVAFGGAGGLHACELADALGIPQVIVTALPGALSAFGILVSDVVKDYSRTVLWRVAKDLPFRRIEHEFSRLRGSAEKDFAEEQWHGGIRYQRTVDVRYRGQGYELNVPYTRELLADFYREHERRYGYSHSEREVELVTLRLRATMKSPRARLSLGSSSSTTKTAKEAAKVIFAGRKVTTGIYDRSQLQPGKKHAGPAVVSEYSGTTVVPPGMRFWVDGAGNLLIAVR
jgi:N-methylhydantoinase A